MTLPPFSFTARAMHSINPRLAPPYIKVLPVCPIHLPIWLALSKYILSMLSEAEQNIPIFSIYVVAVIVHKYLQFSINSNKFYCIFVALIQ